MRFLIFIFLMASTLYADVCDLCGGSPITLTITQACEAKSVKVPTSEDLKKAGISEEKLPLETCDSCKEKIQIEVQQYIDEVAAVDKAAVSAELKADAKIACYQNMLRKLKNLVEPDPPAPSPTIPITPQPSPQLDISDIPVEQPH